MMMILNNDTDCRAEDILARLDAMKVQEATAIRNKRANSASYTGEIDPSCRKAMLQWIQQVQTTLSLSPETVWIAMSFFDRYLESGRGISQKVLNSRRKFQLAAITCFYTAVKVYEPVVLGLDMLVKICRGTYTEEDIADMEKDILSALEWRVSCHTPMDVARSLLELTDIPSFVEESLLKACQEHLNYAVTDMDFSSCSPSTVGIACLASSLIESEALSFSQKQDIWMGLSVLTSFDLTSQEVLRAQRCLSSQATPCKQRHTSKLDRVQSTSAAVTAYTVEDISSSPVCVSQTARQA